MALLPIQQMTAAGLQPSLAAAAGGGDTVQGVDDRCWLEVSNADATPTNVTIGDPGKTPAGSSGSPAAVAVANGAVRKQIPMGPGNVDPATALVSITYSKVTSLTVAVVRR